MMQHNPASCQPGKADDTKKPRKGTWTPAWTETVHGTTSRHSAPRIWRRALQRTITAGHLPGANTTTTVVLEDLHGRMDYATGQVRYCLADTAARLGMDRSTVKRHIALLRKAGWLAWTEHGSLRNVLTAGYARTATVYAATIPTNFDAWAGNRLDGVGYGARVVGVTEAGREQQAAEAVDKSTVGAVDNPRSGSSAPPSLTVVKEESHVQEVDGFKDTSRKRASRQNRSLPQPYRRRTPHQAAHDIRLAAHIRPRVTWTQSESLRRLAVALRPLIDRGLNAHDIVTELHYWGLTWRPTQPAAYIRSQLALQAAQAEQDAAEAAADAAAGLIPWEQSTAYRQEQQEIAALEALLGPVAAPEPEPYTDEQRRAARAYALLPGGIDEAIDHLVQYGDDDTLDLYGTKIAAAAARLLASPNYRRRGVLA